MATKTSVRQMVDEIVKEYQADPRNKVFVPWTLLVASAAEETGKAVKPEALSRALRAFQSGEMTGKDESLYDGAVAVCGALARACFGDDPDADVDYDVSWDEANDGEWNAEVRPS